MCDFYWSPEVGRVISETYSELGYGFPDSFTGTSTGAPLSLTRNTRNFAGLAVLAFRPTRWTSSPVLDL